MEQKSTHKSDETQASKQRIEAEKTFPYKEIDVSYQNKQARIKLSGTLTLPLTENKRPVVILISGSGPLDRDSTFLGYKPFLSIADNLTRKGIAVLRFDKRGVGKSTGDMNTAITEDLAQDVFAAIEYLKTVKEIDPQQIGLIGTSEGGIIALMLASRTKDVTYIVMVGSPVLPGKDNATLVFTLLVNEGQTNMKKFSEDKILFDRFFDLVAKEAPTDGEKKESIEIAKKMLPRINEKTKVVLGFSQLPPEVFISIFSIPWMKEYLNSRPESFLRKVTCPVLAIYGNKDVQAPAKENIEAINRTLKQNKKTDYTIKEIPDVNHLMQNCITGYPSEYETINKEVSPEIVNLLAVWISDRTKM